MFLGLKWCCYEHINFIFSFAGPKGCIPIEKMTETNMAVQLDPQHVANFIVKEPSCLSDHSPIVTWLNINTNISNRDAIPANDTLTS